MVLKKEMAAEVSPSLRAVKKPEPKIAKPTMAIITNVGTAHIGFLGSRENILKAKTEVVANMPEDGLAILNADDDMLVKINNDLKKIWYGKNCYI